MHLRLTTLPMAATLSLSHGKSRRTTSQQCATSSHKRRWSLFDRSMISVSPACKQHHQHASCACMSDAEALVNTACMLTCRGTRTSHAGYLLSSIISTVHRPRSLTCSQSAVAVSAHTCRVMRKTKEP